MWEDLWDDLVKQSNRGQRIDITLTSALLSDRYGWLAFSKHHIGLLYIALECTYLVCNPFLQALILFILSVNIDHVRQ